MKYIVYIIPSIVAVLTLPIFAAFLANVHGKHLINVCDSIEVGSLITGAEKSINEKAFFASIRNHDGFYYDEEWVDPRISISTPLWSNVGCSIYHKDGKVIGHAHDLLVGIDIFDFEIKLSD